MLDGKRHRAADRRQGCRRDYCQTVGAHGQSGGRRGGHICEKGHTFAKGLGQRCRTEPERHIVRSPPRPRRPKPKCPRLRQRLKRVLSLPPFWCRPESNARVKSNVPTIQFSLPPSPPVGKGFGRFTWHLAVIGAEGARQRSRFDPLLNEAYEPRLRKGYTFWLGRRRLEDPAHVNSFTRRLRGKRYRHRHARGDTDACRCRPLEPFAAASHPFGAAP